MSTWEIVARVLGALGGVVGFVALGSVLRERRRERARQAYIADARLAAMKLVVDFEHTPVRGASRDRSLSGKARRQARRG